MDQNILKELHEIKKVLNNVVTKNDASNFVTKNDMVSMEKRLTEKIDRLDQMQMDIFATVQKIKADRVDVKELEIRVEKIERKLVS